MKTHNVFNVDVATEQEWAYGPWRACLVATVTPVDERVEQVAPGSSTIHPDRKVVWNHLETRHDTEDGAVTKALITKAAFVADLQRGRFRRNARGTYVRIAG